MEIGIREGDYVMPKTKMYTLADLSKVWVLVDVYEFELPWIQENDTAEMTFAGIPDKSYIGKVTYIYPYMEKKTRTVRVRLEFDNNEGLLKPDMFTTVTIKAGRNIEAVVVPAEAIVRSGERNQVFIRREKGKFEPREVRTGVTAAGMTQILEGVEPGEVVVTSSQFLIDSESKLREATAKMLEGLRAKPVPQESPAQSEDMDMSDMKIEDPGKEDLDMSGMKLENLK
jgi:Cu(I)/Ag(I) efflux system membrane fusion protein